MKKMVIACSGARHISKKIAKKTQSSYSELSVKKFPDNELGIRIMENVKNKEVFLVQSFYSNLNEKIVETLFACYTARDLGAKKVNLIALYFPYLRKDKRFKPGDCVSSEVMSKLFKIFNKVFIVGPHLHRIKKLNELFKNAKKISVAQIISDYINKQNLKDIIIIGPDIESSQWAKKIAKILHTDFVLFRKKRFSSKKVKIKVSKKIGFKDKNLIIIDDIISTGHTMLETIKAIKKFKPKKIYCIAIHGVFSEDSLKKLRKNSIVLSTNTIPSKVSKINISDAVSKILI